MQDPDILPTDNQETSETHEPEQPEAIFDQAQIRILGCLMEKQLTTPDNYPLTLNSVMLACNQKTNRHPKMNMTQGETANAVNKLNDMEHVRTKFGSRSDKYSHAMRGNFNLDKKQQAILCVMMLREPLTISDIAARTARMTEFEDKGEIQKILRDVSTRATPLAQLIPAATGRREDRYTHCFSGKIDVDSLAATASSTTTTVDESASTSRLDELEARVEKLEKILDDLMS